MQFYCIPDYKTNTCRDAICSDMADYESCSIPLINMYNLTMLKCKWESDSCSDITQNDIDALTNKLECVNLSINTYKWKNSKCIACTSFQINPLYEARKALLFNILLYVNLILFVIQ